MGFGTAVRHRLGRLEVPTAEFYRSRFINLDDLADTLASLRPGKRILEIGCGDGSFADRLCGAFPDAHYVGLDVSAAPGRLFRGDPARAQFHTLLTSQYLERNPDERFDLVAVVDVLHHVPVDQRLGLLRDAATLTTPGGLVVVKEWERDHNPAHLATYLSDRYVSGDRGVRFLSGSELTDLLAEGLPGWPVVLRGRIPPRRNNVLFVLRKDA